MKYIFGPVPSRRLGLSLGIDILPKKTCNMNCIYCEIGKTDKVTNEVKSYSSWKDIFNELKNYLKNRKNQIDCITFTASGEPTLHKDLNKLIKATKQITKKPIIILTNSSLVNNKEVFSSLIEANLVLPSLDAATEKCFKKINRPHPDLKIRDIIDGLSKLKKEMKGEMWLEILFVKGINDNKKELIALKEAISKIAPDKIQLNTVTRPPAEEFARPVSENELINIKEFLGNNAEIIVDFKAKILEGSQVIIESEILDTLKRRPLSIEDFNELFGNIKNSQKIIDKLLSNRKINKKIIQNKTYFCLT